MEVYLLIAAIALTFWLYPYARTLLKRLTLLCKLRRACRSKGYALIPNRVFWFLGRRGGQDCDFFVETPECVYPVKLFGMKSRRQKLILYSTGRYVIRRYIGIIGKVSAALIPVDSKPKPLPAYNFQAGFREEWYFKSIRPVLLLNPTCAEVRVEQDHREIILGNSEAFSGMILFTLPGFLGELDGSNPLQYSERTDLP